MITMMVMIKATRKSNDDNKNINNDEGEEDVADGYDDEDDDNTNMNDSTNNDASRLNYRLEPHLLASHRSVSPNVMWAATLHWTGQPKSGRPTWTGK